MMGGGAAHALVGRRAGGHDDGGDEQEARGRGGMGEGKDSYLTAALGYNWAHAVNTRLVVEADGGRRLLSIAKSPLAPNAVVAYAVDARGVVPAAGAGAGATTAPQQGSAAHRRIGNAGAIGCGGVALAARDDTDTAGGRAGPAGGSEDEEDTQAYTLAAATVASD